jgi:glutamate 5-kinase
MTNTKVSDYSALVAVAFSADHLFLLSDVDYLYETNSRKGRFDTKKQKLR